MGTSSTCSIDNLNPREWLTLLLEDEVEFEDLPELLRRNRDFARRLLEIDGSFIQHLNDELRMDEELTILSLETGAEFHDVSPMFRSNREVMYAAIKSAGFFPEQSPLIDASDDLRGDPGIVLEAIKRDGKAFKAIAKPLQFNLDFLTKVLRHNSSTFQFFPLSIRDNTEFILTLLTGTHVIDPHILEWASKKVRDDEHVILAAIELDHSCYSYASKKLKMSPSILRLKHTFLRDDI
ncbi:DUF4116 domain-containing protein [bacterium]|nr:DUF4116 domain-containing protein [bacterium]